MLDEWLATGFARVFGHAPKKTDLLFPAREIGRRKVAAVDTGKSSSIIRASRAPSWRAASVSVEPR
jgi:hypothetical protein